VLTVVENAAKKGRCLRSSVEFFRPGLDSMTAGRPRHIGNMGPEYGATCGFPSRFDGETINYLTIRPERKPHQAG